MPSRVIVSVSQDPEDGLGMPDTTNGSGGPVALALVALAGPRIKQLMVKHRLGWPKNPLAKGT